jgi:hypothetical protein
MGAVEPETDHVTHSTDRDHEPHHAASSTASLLTELQMFGHRPFQGEPDTRPLPEPQQVGIALADIFDALVATFTDTRLEDLLWSTVNLFHRVGDRIERDSTATSRRSAGARKSRTAPRFDRSSWSGYWRRARH